MSSKQDAAILVVDDQEMNRDLLSRRLQKRGYRVETASSGAEALERIGAGKLDLVLLDIMMPGISGLEVLQEVRKRHSAVDLPIIMATARDESSMVVEALALGANDYVTKPLDWPVVFARVQTQLSLKQATEENRRLVTQLEEANRRLERLAGLDGLTGIANRRSFEQYLSQTWRTASRNKAFLSLIMIDVDLFKAYNDTYGHQAGDECLKRVAASLAETPGRAGDMVARYGGEEFVVVLDQTDAEGVWAVAERLRAGVEALGIVHAASRVAGHVTLSLGVATATPGPELTPQVLIEAADQALYRAKREGRNRTVRAEDGFLPEAGSSGAPA